MVVLFLITSQTTMFQKRHRWDIITCPSPNCTDAFSKLVSYSQITITQCFEVCTVIAMCPFIGYWSVFVIAATFNKSSPCTGKLEVKPTFLPFPSLHGLVLEIQLEVEKEASTTSR